MLLVLWLAACIDTEVHAVRDEAPPGGDTGADPGPDRRETGMDLDTADSAGIEDTDEPPAEECNGRDDDGDRDVDEGFGDSDADGTADCVDAEECDGLDNDGDAQVDEDFDEDADGIPDCDEVDHEVLVRLTADDAFELYYDGVSVFSDANWNDDHDVPTTMESGPHAIAVHAWDLYGMPSGFIALLEVDRAVESVTGDGTWVYTRATPDPSWADIDFDDSAWTVPAVCTGGWWGGSPASIVAAGGAWTWEGDCTGTGEAWFRRRLDLP